MDVSSRGLNRRSVLVLNSHSAITTEPSHQSEGRRWKTGISPFIDEEICWWGYWCCWLVQARTADSFGVGSSRTQITYFLIFVVSSALIFNYVHPFAGISFVIIGSIVLACIRASVRAGIRRKLNIFGSFFDDFLTHLCCSICAICQEAREGKLLRTDPLDCCTGENLLAQEEAYRNNTGQNKRSAIDTSVEGNKFYNHLKSISKTSWIILVLSTVALITLLSVLGSQKKFLDMAVVCAILVQPVVILYFIYWRTRKHHTSLDLVIKCLAIGYWLSSGQCYVLRTVSTGILLFIVGLISVGAYKSIETPGNFEPIEPWIFVSSPWNESSLRDVSNVNHIQQYNISDNTTRPQGTLLNMTTQSADHGFQIPYSADAATSAHANSSFLLLFVSYVISAFLIKVVTDEIVKHYIVRCFPFTSPLKNPQCVLVYLLSGALGFAVNENLDLIPKILNSEFNYYTVIRSVLKILLPIHAVCAYLQAFNLSKVLVQKIELSLLRILLSSIFIHGIFDCAGYGVRGLSYAPGYSRYFFYACAALVAAFILFSSILISRYTKMESELGNHEDDEDYDDASEIALLL